MWNKTDWTSRTNGDGLVPGKLITTYAGEFSLHLHGKSSALRRAKKNSTVRRQRGIFPFS